MSLGLSLFLMKKKFNNLVSIAYDQRNYQYSIHYLASNALLLIYNLKVVIEKNEL